ncbi:hypothetical protein LTR85_004902 [Meristemomyces frigidus]|nr:hypothetical protein LTR85_004902 [Meristemomyces frigidus]
MSKAASSPTARLLQSSRLFSLPRPLPQPQLETITSSGIYRASDTATLPYPTHQAIATPPSSHFRGDWGLKRPLPGKATKTSTPHIRISAQDTSEHITDFGSAADHTQTEAKWLEMGVPVLHRAAKDRDRKTPPLSVFEEAMDNTDAGNVGGMGVGGQQVGEQKQRWKYAGPWIAGMQEGDFNLFTRRVEKRKGEFREFVKTSIAEQRLADRRRRTQDKGQVLAMQDVIQLRQQLRPGDAEMVEIEKAMRDNHAMEGLSSELTSLICDFLDLPAVRPTEETSMSARTAGLRGLLTGLSEDADAIESAPPSTHPSAGLSYIRTNAIMENHPLHGPQAHRSPVLARVVRPRNSVQGTEYQAKLGVGGIVAPDPISATMNTSAEKFGRSNSNAPGAAGISDYDPDINANALLEDQEGGNKMWVHPQTAYVDENGRIRLAVARGDREAVAVRRGDVEHIHESRAAATRGMVGGGGGPGALPGTPGNANFGYSLPFADRRRAPPAGDAGEMPAFSRGSGTPSRGQAAADYGAGLGGGEHVAPRRRPEVRGFDEELGRRAGEGRMDDESATSRIRELLESRGRR